MIACEQKASWKTLVPRIWKIDSKHSWNGRFDPIEEPAHEKSHLITEMACKGALSSGKPQAWFKTSGVSAKKYSSRRFVLLSRILSFQAFNVS